jgi:hypothetical protein
MSKRGGITAAQRASFFSKWWPACCEVQGWDPKSETVRRAHILEATKGKTDRMSLCSQAQLTAIFQLTWFKTNPNSLNAAIPVANPEEALEADEQRRAIFSLSGKGLTTEEIAKIAAPLCRKHHVSDWQRLPSKVLKSIMHWKQFQPEEIARLRRPVALPLVQTAEESRIYYLRPSPNPQPAVAGPF